MKKKIFVLGGGGFSMEPENLKLDQYLLNLSENEKPKICFLPTASGDSREYIDRFYTAYKQLECRPSHLSLFRPFTQNIHSFLLKQHIIFVGGGNTRNMLTLWREWSLDQTLKNALENGVILSGLSAGAICWFEQGVTDSFGPELQAMDCLGWLPGSCSPHYDGEEERRPTFHQLQKDSGLAPGYGIDDNVGLLFEDQKLTQAVRSVPDKFAYFVEAGDEKKVVPKDL